MGAGTHSSMPMAPVRRIVTEDEAARLRPLQLVRIAGFTFAQLADGWAMVDTCANDNRRDVDDA